MNHKSLNQLLCAATVNVRFRETLLRDPAKAIASGYFDQSFALTQEERDLVVGIRAKGLEDFAAQVYHFVSGNGNGTTLSRYGHNGHNGNGHNGNGHNGNGHNGNGHKKELLPSADALVDLYRAPALAHA
jgi:hypothetical protein